MFPIRNDYGEVIAFSGRVLDPAAARKIRQLARHTLFNKGRVLYGLDKSKRALIEASTAIVCEGQIDVISAFEAGVRNVIAPQGTALLQSKRACSEDSSSRSFFVLTPTKRARRRSAVRLGPVGVRSEVRVALLPEGEDPDSLIRSKGVTFPQRRAARRLDYALEHLAQNGSLENPAGKLRAARKLGPYVAAIDGHRPPRVDGSNDLRSPGDYRAAFAPHVKPATFESETANISRKFSAFPCRKVSGNFVGFH